MSTFSVIYVNIKCVTVWCFCGHMWACEDSFDRSQSQESVNLSADQVVIEKAPLDLKINSLKM